MMVAAPVTKSAATTSVCPCPGVPTFVDKGGYVVHPAPAVPSSTRNEATTSTSDRTNVQNDSMFRNGNAMSCAPIISGMVKFPKQPIMKGVIAKKIMISPCIVKMLWYDAGVMMPPERDRNAPSTGTGEPG